MTSSSARSSCGFSRRWATARAVRQRLRRALELKLFEDRRDTIQLTSLVSSVVDPETRLKIDAIRDRLIAQCGYHPASAEDVLQRVADLFARGETKQGTSEAA